MGELHPVEAAWRRFRQDKSNLEVINQCWNRAPRTLEKLRVEGGISAWPSGVVLSQAVTGIMMKAAELEIYPERRHLPLPPAYRDFGNTMHVWSAYRECKTIYRVEPYLAECLSHTPWPDDAPAEALRLLSYCPVLEFRWRGKTTYAAATYDIVPFAPDRVSVNISCFAPTEPNSDPELISSHSVWRAISVLSLVRETLVECVEHTVHETNASFPGHARFDYLHNELAGFVVTLLLYLAGEPDTVRLVHAGERPRVKDAIRRRDPERFKDLREPTVSAVGTSFTRAIERWEIEHARELNEPTGKTVRPHFRRAHPHKYWTGKGREISRYRYLLPISVKGGRIVEEPTHPLEAQVR